MRKLYIFILFMAVLTFVSYSSAVIIIRTAPPTGAPPSCSLSYDGGWTADTERPFGSASAVDFYGIIYTPTSDEDVCAIDIYIYNINEDLTDKYYRAVILTWNATGPTCDTWLGHSDQVSGDDFVAGTWTSANAGLFEFSSAVSLTGSNTYLIGIYADTDGTPDDDPEHDLVNYASFGDDNNNNGDSITGGRAYCAWDSSIPYGGVMVDENDDILFRVHTE